MSGQLRYAALALHGGLMLGLPAVAGLIGALLVVPLLLPLPGLWRGRPYTYAWCSMLIVIYAGGFLMEAFSGSAAKAAMLALAVIAALEFCALLLFVRVRAAERRAATVE